MFMSCDRFKKNSGKSFAGQSGALARVASNTGVTCAAALSIASRPRAEPISFLESIG